MTNQKTLDTLFTVAEQYRPIGRPIMTGLQQFDRAMDGGVRGGELVTISGMSGHGKTSYALWQTKIIADSGVPTMWFTYEMNPWYLKEKMVKLGADEKLATFVPMDHKGNTYDWIKAKIIEAQQNHACKVFFIDHLHYLIPANEGKNSSLLIGGVVRMLKQLAVENDVIIYLIAHMKRLGDGERANIDAVRDSALIVNESDYTYIVERLKMKQAKGKLNESMNDPFESDYSYVSKIQLAKNRRTGTLTNLYFEVRDQDFIELTREQVKVLAATVQL